MAFALTPGAGLAGVIDYSTAEGRKFYSIATRPLDPDNRYDATPEGLLPFLKELNRKATEYNWNAYDDTVNWEGQGILTIPDNVNDNNCDSKPLLNDYGQISLEKVREYSALLIDQQTRDAQDIRQLYTLIMNSLSPEGRDKVMVWEKDFTVNNMPCGISLLKVLIRESHIDTNATSSHICGQLAALDEYIPTIAHDITKFNAYVKGCISALSARGETTNDLMVNLFTAYKAVPDRRFLKYIESKEEKYEEGDSMTPDQLMLLADTKYKTLVQKRQWNALSKEEEKIVALQVQLKEVEKKLQKKRKDLGEDESKKKQKKRKDPEFPDWFTIEPSEDKLNEPRKWNGAKWWYCSQKTGGKCDGIYRRHHPSKCKGLAKTATTAQTTTDSTSSDKDSGKHDKRVKLSKALAAIQEISDGEE